MTGDRVDDQSLGRSCGLFPGSRVLEFPGSRALESRDIRMVEGSRDITRDTSGDTFPGSRGRRVVLTM